MSLTGSMWVRPTTRWACYLRDDLTCVYCLSMVKDLAATPTNFLTLDHFAPRASGDHSPTNLVTACYACNNSRGKKSLRAWCAEQGWDYTEVLGRSWRARHQDVAQFRQAARLALGLVPGIPQAQVVTIMRWRARQQWAGWQEKMAWAADAEPTCDACGQPLVDELEEVPF